MEERSYFSGMFEAYAVIFCPPDASPFSLVFRSNAWTVVFLLCMRSIWAP